MISTEHISPQELADSLVEVCARPLDGLYFVELRKILPEPVIVGPHHHRAVAEYEATRIKQYIAALVSQVRQETGDSADSFGTELAF